ncbi:hypothetical protein BD309DRAFT_989486 [Dichomitus squalens]|uniref:Uncharacterized protein n=1 Tax=Dichomitus squalens TaxID=114155 RepID=A0A4Q9NXM6_9APHY|nr:uncharacterized protein DICSQDRAFT_179262 [Dichomitus squalens LYAD-421 SS1]EJF63259.1 hypothetical protein DICSQDRAFT_179262 [Dichomitus squalens LYAD-421 SS1]TBU30031.1 hypothetical protein BD311DRAFT_660177 [Dichomitus squalens]TBU45507.1 hypothetical protein BD309DRAFT_989486 [Dichomitus squalens]TBU59060.1 hypothetical protein BD310DRAFT_818207 [Dichomitus squalens]
MSSASTPLPSSGYASPAPLLTTPAPPKPNNAAPKPKPVNVFSNDGSFLERFQRLKKEEDEKKKQEEILAKCGSFTLNLSCIATNHLRLPHRKREFDNRFKNRGKRRSPDTSSSTPATENPAKKAKVEEPLSESSHSGIASVSDESTERTQDQYKKELQNYADRSLKDSGIGVRPLVK